ncbi:MAG: pilus assembly protein TadG-related protein, partial [Pseudomonadota bacterium]
MMFGLFLIPMLVGAGIAIDMLRANLVRAELREAADAGVLAAARARILDASLTDDEAEAIARRLFDGNNPASGGDVVIDVFEFAADSSGDRFTLEIDARLPATLLSVVGQPFIPVSINAEATGSPAGPVEVAMVLDNTGSMGEGTKLQDLKDSATMLVNALL